MDNALGEPMADLRLKEGQKIHIASVAGKAGGRRNRDASSGASSLLPPPPPAAPPATGVFAASWATAPVTMDEISGMTPAFRPQASGEWGGENGGLLAGDPGVEGGSGSGADVDDEWGDFESG